MKYLCCSFFFVTLFIYCLALQRKSKACQCGKMNNFAGRIVSGVESVPHRFPWMAAILKENKMYCGGSLINNLYILTAGHCIDQAQKKPLSVLLGYHELIPKKGKKKVGLRLKIVKTILHENFISYDLYDENDIGLMKLEKPVEYTSTISPVCLPKKDGSTYESALATVAGWGLLANKGKSSNVLMTTNVTVKSNKECKKYKGVGKDITEAMLCGYGGSTDACQGDSGGPLFLENKSGKVEQIGVVSWGLGCADIHNPGVYSRTTYFADWIAENTKDATYCT